VLAAVPAGLSKQHLNRAAFATRQVLLARKQLMDEELD